MAPVIGLRILSAPAALAFVLALTLLPGKVVAQTNRGVTPPGASSPIETSPQPTQSEQHRDDCSIEERRSCNCVPREPRCGDRDGCESRCDDRSRHVATCGDYDRDDPGRKGGYRETGGTDGLSHPLIFAAT